MKTVTLLPKFIVSFIFLFVLPAATVLAQDYSYYYYSGEKISFTPSPTRIAIRYKSEAAMENKRFRLTQQNTQLQRPESVADRSAQYNMARDYRYGTKGTACQ